MNVSDKRIDWSVSELEQKKKSLLASRVQPQAGFGENSREMTKVATAVFGKRILAFCFTLRADDVRGKTHFYLEAACHQ